MGSFLQLLYVSLKTICGCAHSEHSQLKEKEKKNPVEAKEISFSSPWGSFYFKSCSKTYRNKSVY